MKTQALQQYYELPGQPDVFVALDQLTPEQGRAIAAKMRGEAKAHSAHAQLLDAFVDVKATIVDET